ncbi:hypothetical protein GBF38_010447, partial [Nibea albiflora]
QGNEKLSQLTFSDHAVLVARPDSTCCPLVEQRPPALQSGPPLQHYQQLDMITLYGCTNTYRNTQRLTAYQMCYSPLWPLRMPDNILKVAAGGENWRCDGYDMIRDKNGNTARHLQQKFLYRQPLCDRLHARLFTRNKLPRSRCGYQLGSESFVNEREHN